MAVPHGLRKPFPNSLSIGYLAICTEPGIAVFKTLPCFLKALVECSPDGHDFTHSLHLRREHLVGALEFLEIESRNLCDDIVDGGLEASTCCSCDVIREFVEGISNRETSRDFGNRIAGSFRGQS